MKKEYLIAVLLLVTLGLVGCTMTAGIALVIDPNPLIFTSVDDLIEGTITVSTTGFGELRVDGFSVVVISSDDGQEVELFAINSADLGFEPLVAPFAVEGFSQSFQLQELLCEQFGQETFTIQDLINLIPAEFGVTTYEELVQMDSIELSFTVEGTETVTEQVGFIFQ